MRRGFQRADLGWDHEAIDAVLRMRPTRMVLDLGAVTPAAVESRVVLTLAQALLKGDKMDDVVRDAVMLGVAEVQPLVTERTEVTRAADHR